MSSMTAEQEKRAKEIKLTAAARLHKNVGPLMERAGSGDDLSAYAFAIAYDVLMLNSIDPMLLDKNRLRAATMAALNYLEMIEGEARNAKY